MKGGKGKQNAWVGFLLVLAVVPCVRAVLFQATGDPTYNTSAPTGSLTNSGWQYEGQWYGWLGTPIAPTFFLTAHHINGNVGDPFILNGFSYTTVALYDDPESDLRIWQVAQTFPYYAPLYTAANEVGNTCMVIGRGTQRGSPVVVVRAGSTLTNGWMWGTDDSVERWGENSVSGVYTGLVATPCCTYPNAQYLSAIFQNNGMSNECDLSLNDSGGGMFIQDGGSTGAWKLAGIHCAVDYFVVNTNGSGSGFSAAVVDYRGLYLEECATGCWALAAPTNSPSPATAPISFLSTRVSTRLSWINSVINYNLGNDLGIAGIQAVGGDAQISLITGTNRLYRVEYTTNLVNAVWTTLTNNIPGTNGTVTVVDPGATTNQPARFYRASVLP